MDGTLVEPVLWNGVVVPTGEKEKEVSKQADFHFEQKLKKYSFEVHIVNLYSFKKQLVDVRVNEYL